MQGGSNLVRPPSTLDRLYSRHVGLKYNNYAELIFDSDYPTCINCYSHFQACRYACLTVYNMAIATNRFPWSVEHRDQCEISKNKQMITH